MKKILKQIYEAIPYKRSFYSLLKKIWTPKERIYRHLHFMNYFDVTIDDKRKFKIFNDTFIENEIFWEGLTGRWEKESMKLWLKLAEKSECVFDIGANNGIYALVAKTVNSKSKVFAFEPHPIFFGNLEKNVKLNNYDISIYKKGVSNIDGDLKIMDYSGETDFINVESISLDEFILTNKLACVDLIKIDVETFEPFVIEGFKNSIALYRPTMLIEILNTDVAKAVSEFINNLDYLYFNINELGGIRQTEKLEKSDYYNYLICQENVAKELELIKNDI